MDIVFCHFKYIIPVSSSLEVQPQKSTKNLLGYFHVMLATHKILCICFQKCLHNIFWCVYFRFVLLDSHSNLGLVNLYIFLDLGSFPVIISSNHLSSCVPVLFFNPLRVYHKYIRFYVWFWKKNTSQA